MGGGGGTGVRQGETGTNNTDNSNAATIANSNFPAFMPGEKERMVSQLASGYGSQISDSLPMDYYRDMSVPRILQPGDITALLLQRGLTPAANSSPATKKPPEDTTGPIVDPPIGNGATAGRVNTVGGNGMNAAEWWKYTR